MLGRRAEDAEAVLRPGLQPAVLEASADGDAGADFLLTLAEARRRLGKPAEAQRALDDCVTPVRPARPDRDPGPSAAGAGRAARRRRRPPGRVHRVQAVPRAAHAAAVGQRDARARAMQAMYETGEARRQSRRYREMSLRDPLTGLYNRRHIDEQLARSARPGGVPAR